jgi:uncharacterized protein
MFYFCSEGNNYFLTYCRYNHRMKIIRSLALLLAFSPVSAIAESESPPACHGRNLYADLKQADPQAYAEVGKAAAKKRNNGPLFWKITPPNGSKPSYLLGTAHVTDTRIATLSQTLTNRMEHSRVAVFELANVGDRLALGADLAADTARTQMPEGQSLWDVIPDDQEPALRNNPMLAKIPADKLSRLQPWLVMMLLSTPPCEQARSAFKFTLDAALSQSAQIYRVDIEGLETVTEQLEVMSSLSLKDQSEMLLGQSNMGIPVEDTFQTLVELYLAHQVSVMEPLMLHLTRNKGVVSQNRSAAFMENFVVKRNRNMAERSRKYLDKGAAFIAVGALHLYGEDGVVELLRKARYKVTAEQ